MLRQHLIVKCIAVQFLIKAWHQIHPVWAKPQIFNGTSMGNSFKEAATLNFSPAKHCLFRKKMCLMINFKTFE